MTQDLIRSTQNLTSLTQNLTRLTKILTRLTQNLTRSTKNLTRSTQNLTRSTKTSLVRLKHPSVKIPQVLNETIFVKMPHCALSRREANQAEVARRAKKRLLLRKVLLPMLNDLSLTVQLHGKVHDLADQNLAGSRNQFDCCLSDLKTNNYYSKMLAPPSINYGSLDHDDQGKTIFSFLKSLNVPF